MNSHSEHRGISPDPDVLGMAAASLCATIVMAIGFWFGMDGLAVAIRAGLVFVVTYATVFLLVRSVVRILIADLVAQSRDRQVQEQRETEEGHPSSETGR
jgi:hypothetical protein